MGEERPGDDLDGLDAQLDEIEAMQVITVIRTHNNFRVETSGMSPDALLANLTRAIVFHCMNEWDNMIDIGEDEAGTGDA